MPAVGGDKAPNVGTMKGVDAEPLDGENVAPEGKMVKPKPLVKVDKREKEAGGEAEEKYRVFHDTALTVQNLYSTNISEGHRQLINNGLKGAMKMSPESIRQAFSFFTAGNIETTLDQVDNQLSNIVEVVADRKNEGFGIIEDVSAKSTAAIQGTFGSLWANVTGMVDQTMAKGKETVSAVNDARCNLVDKTSAYTGETIVWGASIVGAGDIAEKHIVPIVKFGGEFAKTPTKAYREAHASAVEILDADQDGELSVADVVATASKAASSVVGVMQKFSIKELAIDTIEAKAAQLGEMIGEEPETAVEEGDAMEEMPTGEFEGCKSWVGQSLEDALKTVPQTAKVLNTLRTKAKRFSSDHKVMRLDLFDIVDQAITTAIVKADALAGEDINDTMNAALVAAQAKVEELREAVKTMLVNPLLSGEMKDSLIKATSAWVASVGDDAWAPINDCTEYIASYKDRMNVEGMKSFVNDTSDLCQHAVGYSRNDEKYGKLEQQLKQLLQSIYNIRFIFITMDEDDG